MLSKSIATIFGTLAFASASTALAGNIEPAPAPTPIMAPAATMTDWSGPFLGAQVGGGSGDTDFRYSGGGAADHGIDGAFGGLYAGYDWQSGANVFGVDLAYNSANIRGSTECPNPSFTCSSDLKDFGAVRGRYGRAFNDFLVYGAAGYAFGNAKADATGPAGPAFPDNSASVDGWTVALGVQKMLQSGWALRGEVAYYDLSASTGAIISDVPGPLNLSMDMTTISVGIEKRW